jgi:hypothetical protein
MLRCRYFHDRTDHRAAAATAGDALFLDFDGTLAGLQDDPDTVFLAAGMMASWRRLATGWKGRWRSCPAVMQVTSRAGCRAVCGGSAIMA